MAGRWIKCKPLRPVQAQVSQPVDAVCHRPIDAVMSPLRIHTVKKYHPEIKPTSSVSSHGDMEIPKYAPLQTVNTPCVRLQSERINEAQVCRYETVASPGQITGVTDDTMTLQDLFMN